MDSPQATGHNLLDSIIFTSFFLGLFSFLAEYSKELVGFSALITIILGLYRLYRIVEGIFKHTKDTE